MRAFEFLKESTNHENEVENFLYSLGGDDVGVEEIGPYRVHFEGFSDWCQQDAQERCGLPQGDPRHLPSYEAVYDEVLQDFIKREGGKQPVDSGLTGDEEYPVFYAIFKNELDEMALPADWDPTAFGHDKTFKSRLDYAKDRAQRLGGGSSRVAFVIPDNGRETVLKVAKNKKGMAQNEAELEVLDDGYLGKMDIVIPLVDYDRENPTPTWLQTEKANKVSQAKLAKMLHAKGNWPMTTFLYAIENILGNRKKNSYMPDLNTIKKEMLEAGSTEQDLDIFFDYVNQVADLVNSSNLLPGDFGNAANWGEYQGRPVIIDLGYSKAVHELYWGQ